jgi:hypothetical protein
MRTLVVELNGEPYCRAGVDEGAVSAFVSHVNIPDEPGGPDVGSTMLAVTGFVRGDSGEPEDQTAVHWGEIGEALEPGDVVTVRLVDADDVDPPTETEMLPPLDD